MNMGRIAGVCILMLAASACVSKRGYVDKGNAFFDQGRYSEAEINYRKAIQKDPNYGDAYYRLGLVELQQNNPLETYNALFRASQLMPGNIEVQEKFGSVCLEYYLRDPSRPQKLYEQVQQTAADLLARDSRSFEGLRLKGYLAYADRKPQDAIAYFRRALEIRPDSAPVTTALVQTLIETGQSPEAEQIATRFLARLKDYGPLYDALYRVYVSSNRIPEAEKVLRTKVENNPRNVEFIQQLAGYYALGGKTAEMKSALRRMLDNPADFPNAQQNVGDFYLQQKDYPEAVQSYQEGERAHPKERAMYQRRAIATLLADKKYADAGRLVQQILKADPNDEVALRIRADLLLLAGGAENATAALKILQDQLSQHPTDVNPALRFQIGRAFRQQGDLDSARAQFSEALRMRSDYAQARYQLAEINLLQQRPAAALEQANAILARNPKDRTARLLYARTLVASGDPVRAQTELAQLVKDAPKDLEARLELGALAFERQKYRDTIETLNDLRSSGDARVFAGLIAAYSRLGQTDKAVEAANEGLKQSPDSTVIREQLAEAATFGGKFNLAISEFQKLIAANPKSVQSYVRLGAVYQLTGDNANAVRLFQQAHDLAPSELGPALTLGEALSQAGRKDEANAVYQTVLKLHPNDATALNNTAYFLSNNGGDLNEALRLARTAVEKVPDQPGFADTLGYVYLKRGQHDSAIQTFSSLVRKYPNYPTYHYHLGMALYETGDKMRAKKELRDALAAHPSAKDTAKIKELLARAG
jgi:tetratricopeptide (TPR) repeat protein